MILADTTLLIDFLRGKKEAIEALHNVQSKGLYTTEINVFELIVGVYAKKQEPQKDVEKMFAMLTQFIILPLERRATMKAGEIAGTLIKQGKQIEETDAFIAAIALTNGISEIITANKAHYERIPGITVVGY